MRSFAVAVALLAGACGGGGAASTTGATAVTTQQDEPARYLALGDSYTIGEGVAPDERWPETLARLLALKGRDVEPTVIARTGWTTAELDRAIDEAAPEAPYDLVTLMIGVNDQFRGLEPAGFRDRFAGLLERAIGFAGGSEAKVVVLTIPDWGVTPFGSAYDPGAVAAEIDAFNRIVAEESTDRGVAVVDVTPLTRERPDLVAADGLHPSPAMHHMWAELALPVALEALSG